MVCGRWSGWARVGQSIRGHAKIVSISPTKFVVHQVEKGSNIMNIIQYIARIEWLSRFYLYTVATGFACDNPFLYYLLYYLVDPSFGEIYRFRGYIR